MLETNNSVVVVTENTARIYGSSPEVVITHVPDSGSVSIKQDSDEVWMDLDEAEALFLVLDTMLHPEEE